jgi:TNF receptor-associated protein 1
MPTTTPEKHEFQAEIAQLLDLVVHSLYTDKEIFVRELISNGADATEKLRFLKTSGAEIVDPDAALRIAISTDETANTITFTDAGVGMTHDELIENLGTIAHSGSKAFLQQLRERSKGGPVDAQLIGQFGVGFYSAFMVADKVVVYSRSANPGETGWIWTSDGRTGYEIEPASDLERGTKVVVHLKETDKDFAKEWRVENIIQRYSNFVPVPIDLNGKELNTVQALWTRNKSEVKPEEYDEFYKYIAHDTEPPLYRLHFNADAPLSIRALLFAPAKNLELATMSREEHHVDLYCKKVLIQARAKNLFPEWLRFLRGVVDSEDLPLNISRETMQDSALVAKLRDVLVKRWLKFLDEEAKADSAKYDQFFRQHGHCLKEGVTTDWSNRELLSKLLRFESSALENGKLTSLTDYVSRMPEEQKEIYFLSAGTREGAEASPYFEVFREKKWEVIFLSDARDEFVLEHLREFDGKKLVPAEKADVKIDKEATGLDADTSRVLAEFVKETLGDRVGEVRVSKRLVGSPAVAVNGDSEMTTNMRRVLRAMQREQELPPAPKPDLELNPDHPLVVGLEKMRHTDATLAQQVAEQIHDQALASANLLEDPRAMLGRMTGLLEKLLSKPASNA